MSDWPHMNSDVVREGAANWVRRFGEWPGWLEHPDTVAREFIAAGAFTRAALVKAGWRQKTEGAE